MQPIIYKSSILLCVTGILCLFLFACNSSREASRKADSAAVAMPKVDSVSVVPVDSPRTRRDTLHP